MCSLKLLCVLILFKFNCSVACLKVNTKKENTQKNRKRNNKNFKIEAKKRK